MSEPALFAFVRDGKTRYFGDRWAAAFLHRELMWGPEELEAWVTQMEEVDEAGFDECSAGVVVDWDRRRLMWAGAQESLSVPRVYAVYERLLKTAWPKFEIQFTEDDVGRLREALGVEVERDDEFDDDEFEHDRPDTIREAAGLYEDDNDDDDEDDMDDELDEDDEEEQTGYDEEDIRAWVTLIDEKGAARHRQLQRLPVDLLEGKPRAIDELSALRPAETPPEAVVAEGMWIDLPKKKVGLWGSSATAAEMNLVRDGWEGWKVQWAEKGYADHCASCGLTGVAMNEGEALARFLPIVLSTKRFDATTFMSAVGGRLKKTAMKATGCLLLVICLPLLLFGAFSGMWKEVLISIGVTCLIVIGGFKIIEFRIRRSFRKSVAAHINDNQPTAPPVAGPLDEGKRRERLDQLLAAAGLPRLAEVEPLFPKESELDLFQ